MPTNDFKPFAVGGGANVEAQADWSAETTLLANGFQAGFAPSAKFNKALRQPSIMAAVLAQFIADLSGQNVIDDGTITTILANLKNIIGGRPGNTYTANDWAYLDKANGLVIQWGSAGNSNNLGSGYTRSTLPYTFVSACFAMAKMGVTSSGGGYPLVDAAIVSKGLGYFDWTAYTNTNAIASSAGTVAIDYISIGV